ncbi:BSD-domain-containing protein [Xylariomycetidae sp. FL0641]|nr:BSD-domain-containing protein [Xylariomycetidae sp. FL0641]
MDLAYDHIAEESLPKDNVKSTDSGKAAEKQPEPQQSLNEEVKDVYDRVRTNLLPWGSWFKQQGETFYQEATKEVSSLGADASRGITTVRERAFSLMNNASTPDPNAQPTNDTNDKGKDKETTTTPTAAEGSNSTADAALSESKLVFQRLQSQASKTLKDIQRAEDAADEALLKFGSTVLDFVRDAVIVKPDGESDGTQRTAHHFESKDTSGKRIIHTTRFEAQMHLLNTTEDKFTEDPASDEWAGWVKSFDVDSKTDDIAADLAQYPELRSTMEKLVPDKVPYADFWKRYYFWRHSLDTAQAVRREVQEQLKEKPNTKEDDDDSLSWGGSDDEEASAPSKATDNPKRPGSTESSTTIHPPAVKDKTHLKPLEPRKSNDERSQADSDTSYDVVGAASGNPSQAPSSPKEGRNAEESDEDDWN